MSEKIEKAMKILLDKIDKTVHRDDALKFTQATLNLTHALATFNHAKNN